MYKFGVGCYAEICVLPTEEQVLHLVLTGMLPIYDDKGSKAELRGQCIRSIHQALKHEDINLKFTKAFIFITHYFPNAVRRDFDNRNRKYLFDALRANQIIADDNWQNISVFEAGYLDKGNAQVEVFISDRENISSVIRYIEQFYIRTKGQNIP